MNGLDLLILLAVTGFNIGAAFRKNEKLGWFTTISTLVLTLFALWVVFSLNS